MSKRWAAEEFQPSRPSRHRAHLSLDRVAAKLHSKIHPYGQLIRTRRGTREQEGIVETTVKQTKKKTNKDGVKFSLNCQFKLEMWNLTVLTISVPK